MPGLDQKGPEGQGPMTGRKMGKCVNIDFRPERFCEIIRNV